MEPGKVAATLVKGSIDARLSDGQFVAVRDAFAKGLYKTAKDRKLFLDASNHAWLVHREVIRP